MAFHEYELTFCLRSKDQSSGAANQTSCNLSPCACLLIASCSHTWRQSLQTSSLFRCEQGEQRQAAFNFQVSELQVDLVGSARRTVAGNVHKVGWYYSSRMHSPCPGLHHICMKRYGAFVDGSHVQAAAVCTGSRVAFIKPSMLLHSCLQSATEFIVADGA